MGWRTGASRVIVVIRGAAYLCATGAVLALVIPWLNGKTLNDALLFALMLLVPAGALWLLSWILAGFVRTEGEAVPNSPTKPRRSPRTVAIRWAIVLGGMIVGGAIAAREGGAFDVGRLVGAMLMVGFLFVLIGRAVQSQWPALPAVEYGPSIVFATAAVLWGVHLYTDRVQENQRAIDAAKQARAMLTAPEDATSVAQSARPSSTPAAQPYNAMTDTMEASNRARTRVGKAMAHYQSALAAAQIDKLLSFDAFAHEDNRRNSERIVETLDGEVSALDREIKGAYSDMEKDMRLVRDRSAEGASAYAGYRESLPETQRLLAAWIQTEHEVFRTVLAFYHFLDDPNVGYTVGNGHIVFQNEANLERYKQYFATLGEVSQREAKAQQRLTDMQRAAISKIDAAISTPAAKPVIAR